MKRIAEFIQNIPEKIELTKREYLLTVAVSALAGIVLGMWFSPRKNITCGCNNGTTVAAEEEEA